MAKMRDVTFYVQIAPTWQSGHGEDRIKTLRVAGTTVTRPRRPKGGTAMVKLTIRVPESAFLPLRPEAVVVIPEDMVITTPIEVVAQPPVEEA